ncbi:MAG: phosphoribosylformylglycinamidine synthase I, partial [Flavobacteriales bacterium]|nr:phosphoribosylformylglycinamidine synthase I [Flavobacteriales bacterium]
IDHANKGGFVMGICNGFQVLCEAGLLPGALLHNESRKFICQNIYLKPESSSCIISSSLTMDKAYKIPIAHGEGNYFADEATLKELNDNDQVIFRYCNADGEVTAESNPNGSAENIAGVCNKTKNVFGMMPHPERAADYELSNLDGKELFDSILATIPA